MWPNLLHGVDDFFWLHRARVDDLIDVLQVTIWKGSGDMDEGFKLWHLTGHEQELLGGSDVELYGMSAGGNAEVQWGNSMSCFARTSPTPIMGMYVSFLLIEYVLISVAEPKAQEEEHRS